MSAESFASRAGELLKKRCRIADFMPARVSSDSTGQLFSAEAYWLGHFDGLGLCARFTNALLKLMCYYRVETDRDGRQENPSPESVALAVREIMSSRSGTLRLLLPEADCLVVFDRDCLHLSVYNAKGRARKIMKKIARSEGLRLRKVKKQLRAYRIGYLQAACFCI